MEFNNNLYEKLIFEYDEFKRNYIINKELKNKIGQDILPKIIIEKLCNSPINIKKINFNYEEISYEDIYIIETIICRLYDNTSYNILINVLINYPINIHLLILNSLFRLTDIKFKMVTNEVDYLKSISKYVLGGKMH